MKETLKKKFKLLKGPMVMVGVTEDCNRRCKHCYNESGGGKYSPSSDELAGNVEKIAQVAGAMNFTGGEPFLRSDLPELLALSHSRGVDNIVTTNGDRFMGKDGPALLDRIQEHVYMMKIGMMGATPATNDYVRGSGHFEVAMRGFDLMAKYNLVTCAKISLAKHNIHEINALAEMAVRHNIDVLVLGQLINIGNASKYMSDLALSQDDLRMAYDNIKQVAEKYAGFVKISPHCTISGACSDHGKFYTVTAHGSVTPCLMREDLAIGNVAQEDVADLFKKVDVLRKTVKTHPSVRDLGTHVHKEEQIMGFIPTTRVYQPGLIV
jgi:MoaA/NifB/PqqE/SkfB family radical SAM enzyme